LDKNQNNEQQQIVFHPDFFVVPDNGEKPYLIGFSCKKCGKMWFPKLPICPDCWSDELEKKPLGRTGKLYTYTVMNVPQPGLKAPLAVGYIDFPEGVRVGAQIDMPPEKIGEIKIGMELEVVAGVVRQDSNGNKVISYRFIPVC